MTRLPSEPPLHPSSPFTPEATIGPFYPDAFLAHMPQRLDQGPPPRARRLEGQTVRVTFRFWDSRGLPVPDMIVEVWQANQHGSYRHPEDRSGDARDPDFQGFARLRSNAEGVATLVTIKPGGHAIPGSPLRRAPHLRLTLFASGIDRLITQMFFAGEAENGLDPILNSIVDPAVRKRLVARRVPTSDTEDDDLPNYEFSVVLRGDEETPFFDDWVP